MYFTQTKTPWQFDVKKPTVVHGKHDFIGPSGGFTSGPVDSMMKWRTMKWQGSFMKNYHIFASSLMFEWTLCFYNHFGKLLRILPFFGVRFENFLETMPPTQTMHHEKRKSLKFTSNIFLQLWSPKTGETIFMIPGFHSWLVFLLTPPQKKKHEKHVVSFRLNSLFNGLQFQHVGHHCREIHGSSGWFRHAVMDISRFSREVFFCRKKQKT